MTTFAALRRGGKELGDAILEPGDPESQLPDRVDPAGGAAADAVQAAASDRATRSPLLTRWVKEGATFDGPSAAETPLASLVDVLADLPKVALKVPAADPVASVAFSPDGRLLAAAVGRQVIALRRRDGKDGRHAGRSSGAVHVGAVHARRRSLVAAGGRPGLFGSVAVWDVAKRKKRLDVRGTLRCDPRRRGRAGRQDPGDGRI